MKKLIIILHPDMDNSVVNKRWRQELEANPEEFVVHDLYAAYPDEKINVQQEQELLERYDTIIYQFPFYWFNCTPLFKKYLDEVYTYGWAYGSKSPWKLQGKKIAMALSVGIDEEEYRQGAKYKYTLEQLTAPFELTFDYVKADYRKFFAFYGMEFNTAADRIEAGVKDYTLFLRAL